ncbi:hypothetical protein EKG38_10730 [Shewanella canadensis]|uniref:Lipoprotein n=1 Tax=Shewanella canadensis TaxID=271096 RepID=A0A3S0J603_9GAMM|nr:hypothetical protein [Shewanella canadensis]RTR38647.1 hypothetical protein EKG38_10730 [Shewanella canadensis]
MEFGKPFICSKLFGKFIVAVFMSFVQGCTTVEKHPDWYTGRTLAIDEQELIGYGHGASKESASDQAFIEISRSIYTDVNSAGSYMYSTLQDEEYSKSDFKGEILSVASLNDTKLIKYEFVGNTFFVAYSYSQLSLAEKIANDNQFECEDNAIFIHQSPLYKSLKRHLGCNPKSNVFSKNKKWYFSVNKKNYPLTESEFMALFVEYSNEMVVIKPSKRVLLESDFYNFEIKTNREGFFSLYQITNSGDVQSLIENKVLMHNEYWVYPDLSLYEGMSLNIDSDRGYNVEMTIASICDKPSQFAFLDQIDTDYLIIDNKAMLSFVLDELSGCDVSSSIVKNKVRQSN